MVAYRMALGVDPLRQSGKPLRLHADKKECRRGMLPLKDIQNLRRVSRIWPVIEGERHLLFLGPVLLYLVGLGKGNHLCRCHQPCARIE